MSNIATVNALITAINFDRFPEIEALHAPDARFVSFRGPILRDSNAIADWHRKFLVDYADCNYADIEYIEDGETVAIRATLEAKGYDWRPFSQRVVETFAFDATGEVVDRRLYGMLRNIEFDKETAAAMKEAEGFKGGSASATRTAVTSFYDALMSGDREAALAAFTARPALIDGVNGIVTGGENILDFLAAIPAPMMGQLRVTGILAGERDALVELAIDPSRPRFAAWVRTVDGKIAVIERYAMLRELGVNPFENLASDRHARSPIFPG